MSNLFDDFDLDIQKVTTGNYYASTNAGISQTCQTCNTCPTDCQTIFYCTWTCPDECAITRNGCWPDPTGMCATQHNCVNTQHTCGNICTMGSGN